jgi:hypothetical protein
MGKETGGEDWSAMSEDVIREGLLAALDRALDDPVAPAALADWFEERGDATAAECLRWLVRNGRRPGCYEEQTLYGKFVWIRLEASPILNQPEAQLPERLWEALTGNDEPYQVLSFKSYQSIRRAFLALIEAWKRVGGPVADPPR